MNLNVACFQAASGLVCLYERGRTAMFLSGTYLAGLDEQRRALDNQINTYQGEGQRPQRTSKRYKINSRSVNPVTTLGAL